MTSLAPISGVCITLSTDDLAGAKALGDRRLSEARRMGLQNKYAARGENERAIHAFGAAGEYAVARFLAVAIPATVNTFHAPDLLDNNIVRLLGQHVAKHAETLFDVSWVGYKSVQGD